MNKLLLHPATKPLLMLAAFGPLAWLLWGAIANTLGPNPAEALIRSSGDWVLRFLCATLAITPLREWTGWSALVRYRRLLGVSAFAYGLVHFLCYAWLDMSLDPRAIIEDIPKRPFILVGTLALLLMAPLAATSFNRAIKALGAARWKRLHRLVYAIVLLALLHFFWMRAAKQNFAEWSVYAAVVALLLGWRLQQAWRRRQRTARLVTA